MPPVTHCGIGMNDENLEYAVPVDCPYPSPENPKFTFIDLFAGIGSFRQGFQSVDGKCVFSSEIDKHARQTYKVNYADVPEGDITKIDKKEIPDHNILCAGFPCQSFSIAGLKKGFQDIRGTMFFEIAETLKVKRPEMFLLENVPFLLHHDNNRTFSVIYKTLTEELGYFCSYKIMDANRYVSQNRKRLFIVGHRLPTLPFYFEQIQIPQKRSRLASILQTDVDDKYTLSDHRWSMIQKYNARQIRYGGGWGVSVVTGKDIGRTLMTNNDNMIVTQQGKNPRKLTPRERARLMGFEDKFKIVVSDYQARRQFGNSVVVPQVRDIAKTMITYLLS